MYQSFQNIRDFTNHLAEQLQRRSSPIAGAIVRAALVKESGRLQFTSGLALFSNQAVEARPTANYGDLILSEEWIPGRVEVVDYLAPRLSGQGSIGGQELGVTFLGTDHTVQRNVGHSQSGWAEQTYTTRVNYLSNPNPRQPFQDPITAVGLKPYLNEAQAVAQWVFGRSDWNSFSGPHDSALITVLPDTRGRITSAQWLPERVAVELELAMDSGVAELQISFEGSRTAPLLIPARQGTLEGPAPDDAQAIFINLQHRDGSCLGRLHLSSLYQKYGPGEHGEVETQLAIGELKAGENDRVEFKPFINPKDNKKEDDLIETVIAFANTFGGRIYIGATDNAVLEGYRALHRAFSDSGDPEEALQSRVRRLVTEKVKPVPKYKMKLLKVFDDPLLVMSIEKGSDPPYATHDNKVWIRKGATDRYPDPKTEFPQQRDRLGLR